TFESLSIFDSYLPPDRLQRRCSASFLVSSGIREHDKRYYYTFAPFDACRLGEWRHSQRLPQHRDDAWSRLRLVFIAPTASDGFCTGRARPAPSRMTVAHRQSEFVNPLNPRSEVTLHRTTWPKSSARTGVHWIIAA